VLKIGFASVVLRRDEMGENKVYNTFFFKVQSSDIVEVN